MSYDDEELKTDDIENEDEFDPSHDILDEHFLEDDGLLPLEDEDEGLDGEFAGLDGSQDY
jgi:hypothetical protein